MEKSKNVNRASLIKLRIGIAFLLVWWLPLYLVVPSIVKTLNISSNKHTDERIVLYVVIIQTIFGFAGLFLVGKELAGTLRTVKYKKLPITIWRLVWSGDENIDESYLKPKKVSKHQPKAN